MFSLAHCIAPRLGSKDNDDQPHAFESREFLRKLLVGKEVQYRIEYTTTTNARDFGSLTLHPSQAVDGETNVARILMKGGYVKFKGNNNNNNRDSTSGGGNASSSILPLSEDQIVLAGLEEEAKAAGKGLWGHEAAGKAPLLVKYTLEENPQELLSKWSKRPISGVVEQVRDGSCLRICLALPTHYQYITLMISGIKAPLYRKDVPGMENVIEPYAEEAKYFVETRLLQCLAPLTVYLEGLNGNNFVGSVHHPNGNIAEALLVEGLAKVVNWTIANVTGGPAAYRAAEAKAKDRRIRMWRDYTPPAALVAKGGKPLEFVGTVTKIITTDMICVTSTTTVGEEAVVTDRKITFSSVRGLKIKDPKEAAYNSEAREFLRGKLIGKDVKVTIDYIRPPAEGFEERECATVLLSGENISVSLVSRGYALVTKHRKDDDARSPHYDALVAAEDTATKQQRGIHSPKDPPSARAVTDASESLSKAKQFLPHLQRGGKLAAVVEFCSTGSRFKVAVPSQNCKLTLVLTGVRTPKLARNPPQDKSEPFAQEALDYVNRYCLQRDVEISVEGVDKVGGFIGSLYITNNNIKQQSSSSSVGALLLQQGFATLHDYSASQSTTYRDLVAAEKVAKDTRKGYWSIVDPATVEVEEVSSGSLRDQKIPTPVHELTVSEISSGGKIFIQVFSDELKKLESLMSEFSIHHSSKSEAALVAPRIGDFCSAKFTLDDNWYRAKIKKVNADKTVDVDYIDFGNSETISTSRIRALDAGFSVSKLPAQAMEVQLAFISIPSLDSDYGPEAYEHLRTLTEQKNLKFVEIGKDKTTGVKTLFLVDNSDFSSNSIQESMLRDGWATVDKKLKRQYDYEQRSMTQAALAAEQRNVVSHGRTSAASNKTLYEVVKALIDAQEVAQKTRKGMMEYGDMADDEEDFSR